MSQFRRGIRKEGMIEALAELACKDGWWRDVLKDTSLIIGVRDDYLNVYWRGQSIFKVEMKHKKICATTHPKYLLNPDLTGQVALDNDSGAFALDGVEALTRVYQPGETLAKLKRAAGLFAGDEKEGVQAIVGKNANVVDVEIAFPAAPGSRSVPRIDIATFNEVDGAVQLIFWEAKVLGNPELRTTGERNVVTQIGNYADVVVEQTSNVIESYGVIARNLVALAEMSEKAREVAEVVKKVAGGAPLTLANPADVRLIVYGFDKAQRDAAWKPLISPLEEKIGVGRVIGRGAPEDIRLDAR